VRCAPRFAEGPRDGCERGIQEFHVVAEELDRDVEFVRDVSGAGSGRLQTPRPVAGLLGLALPQFLRRPLRDVADHPRRRRIVGFAGRGQRQPDWDLGPVAPPRRRGKRMRDLGLGVRGAAAVAARRRAIDVRPDASGGCRTSPPPPR
jgi:hypothetical protein